MLRYGVQRIVAGTILATYLTGSMSSHAHAIDADVRFLIRAFISKDHPGRSNYIKKTEKGTYVVPAPPFPTTSQGVAGVQAYDTKTLKYYEQSLKQTCFETDNRAFSSDPSASARATAEIVLLIRGRNVTVAAPPGRSKNRIGPTGHVDCKTGINITEPKTASQDTVSVGEISIDRFRSTVNIRAASPNPFYLLAQFGSMAISLAPDIDFTAAITFDALKRAIEVKGMAGYFPSFEAYYQVNDGPVEKIINWDPYGDSTAFSLFDLNLGINTRNFEHEIKLR